MAEDVKLREGDMVHKVAQPDQHRILTNGAGDGCGKAVTRKLLLRGRWEILRVTRFSWIKKAMIGGYELGRVAANSVPKTQVYRIFQPGTRLCNGHTSLITQSVVRHGKTIPSFDLKDLDPNPGSQVRSASAIR